MGAACIARVAATVAAVAALAACNSGGPDDGPAATYELALVNGQAVPAVYLTYGFGAQKRLVTGSLELTSGTRLMDVRHITNTPYGADPIIEDFHDTTSHAYRIAGDLFIIDRTNPGAPGAAYSDTGLVDGDVLYLTVATVDGTPNQRRSLTYVRRR